MLSTNTLKPLAQRVKQQTEVQHLSLEELIVPQIRAVQAVDDYARLLHIFYGYNKPVEEAIHKMIDPAVLPDIQKRQKADLMLHDLKSLGLTHQPLMCASIPSINTLEQAFGALYVLEGSTLGGRSITQLLLKTNIDIQPDSLQFFNAYGKETGSMWMAFLNHLNTFAAEDQQRMIIETANETFLKFRYWIQQQVPQVR